MEFKNSPIEELARIIDVVARIALTSLSSINNIKYIDVIFMAITDNLSSAYDNEEKVAELAASYKLPALEMCMK
jgi:hypothetical protein